MKFSSCVLCIVTMMACIPSAVSAADLLGEWVQTDHWGARSLKHGEHELEHKSRFPTHEQSLFRFTVTELSPDGRGFHAEWCSKNKCEEVVGVVKSDGSLRAVDEDSYFEGVLLGDTLELCTLEAGPAFRVAACKMMQKE